MESHLVLCLSVVAIASLGWSLPPTLLEDAGGAGMHLDNKVKRSHELEKLDINAESNPSLPVTFFTNPSAVKRGMRPGPIEESDGDWEPERAEPKQDMPDKPYFADENPFEEKSVREYEKGFHYGTNKAKLDEQMENAILKSEMYGEPVSINQYRYFGGSDDTRRKRSNAKRSFSRINRFKREVELSPEEILALLSLLEKEKHNQPYGYRSYWTKDDGNDDKDVNGIEESDEGWMDGPVSPGMKNSMYPQQINREYPRFANNFEVAYNPQQRLYAKRQWDDYEDRKRKRFMVSKRFDPTKKLRYLNGPAQGRDDLYSLSQLLGGAQREPNVPMVHRMVL